MAEKRPHLRIPPQKPDKCLEVAGWGVVLASWLLVVISFSDLPELIPIHYDFTGAVTKWGVKGRIFLLPAIATLLFIGITILNHYPYRMNYPVNITSKNAFRYYTIATRFNRYIKLLIALIFFIISLRTIEIAHGHSGQFGFWSIPIIVVLFVFPMTTLLVYLFKEEKRGMEKKER